MSIRRPTIAALLSGVALSCAVPAQAQSGTSIVMRIPIRTEQTRTPNPQPAPPPGTATWKEGDWTWASADYCTTSAPQTRTVECVRDGSVVADAACAPTPRPEAKRTASRTAGCQFFWKAGTWGDPVAACGETTQSRTMTCTRTDGSPAGNDALCTTRKGETVQASVDFSTCGYGWTAGEWDSWNSRCSANAVRTREIVCTRSDGAPFDASNCKETPPKTVETASIFDSCTNQWSIGPWSKPVSPTQCGSHDESRIVRCVSQTGAVVEESKCTDAKPEVDRTVTDLSGCTPESYSWDIGEWSNNDPFCGVRDQERTAVCRRADGVAVEADKCGKVEVPKTRKFNDSRTCSYEWTIAPWNTWSDSCSAAATRSREVKCQRSDGSTASESYCTGAKPVDKEGGAVFSGCQYSWTVGEWEGVSGCGEVPQKRYVACKRSDKTTVDDSMCSENPRPDDVRTAEAYDACTYANVPGEWSTWNSTCSATAERSREVICVRGDGKTVGPSWCSSLPAVASNEKSAVYTGCSYSWKGVGWSAVPKGCGTVKQSEIMQCTRSDGTPVEDSLCGTSKPTSTRDVQVEDTCTYSWALGSWDPWNSLCSAKAQRNRSVICERNDGQAAPGKCTETQPASQETSEIYTGCTYAWEPSGWTSAPYCGPVTENRTLTCRRSDKTAVADSFCTGARPETTRQGTNYETCTYAWMAGTWSDYSSTCSTSAQRTRSVTCQRSDKVTVTGDKCTGTAPANSEQASVFTGCKYTWKTSDWVSSYSCSEADTQTRQVDCVRMDNANTVVQDSLCSGMGAKPASTQTVRNTSSCSASMVNGGFESDLYGWNSTAPIQVSTTVSHGGTKSIKMDPNGQLRQYVQTVNGRRYTLSYWAYTRNGQYMNSYGPNGAVIENRGLANSTLQWVYFSGTFIGNGQVVGIGFYHYAPSGGSSWLDDVTVTPN